MSSSEEYLDSLLDSILSGGKSEEEEKPAAEASRDDFAENKAADAGKAMSPDEIEEMLVSMGTLGGGDEGSQEQGAAEQEDASAGSDDFAVDDLSLDNFASEESGADDGAPEALDELSLDDLTTEEPESDAGAADDLGDLSLDDLDTGENDSDFAIEELTLDDLTTEEPEPDAGAADALDDLSLDDLDTGESDSDFTIEELTLDDLTTEEPEPDAGAADALDDLSLDDLDTGESDSDFAIEELSLDDLTTEAAEAEADGGEAEASDEFSLDDLDMGESASDDFSSEEAGGEEDDDLSALLAGMEHDEDLSEINDLLEESEQGVTADDDMLAMLEGSEEGGDNSFDLFESDEAAKEAEGIRELSPEEVAAREGGKPEKKEKKRRKLFGRKKKEKEEGTETSAEDAGDELEALLGEVSPEQAPQEEKKPGFFAKLLAFLLESDEEDEDPVAAEVLADNAGETGAVTDENKELLQELSEEDKKGKKKKKKGKKGKKGKEGEEGEEAEGEEEEEGKKAKKKKKKKEKEKKDEEVDLFAPPEKKLSKKKVITVFLFCGTIAACIILLSSFLPNTMEKRDAHIAYDHGEYGDVYDLLYGKKRNEQDEILFQRSNLILQMNRKLSSYDNYVNLDMRLEALNALITGVERYQQILPQAETYNVVGEVNDIYTQILERLSAEFGVSEEEALDIIASEDDVTYSQRLEAIVNGELYGDEDEGGIRDMLPEEEEIIERIEGAE